MFERKGSGKRAALSSLSSASLVSSSLMKLSGQASTSCRPIFFLTVLNQTPHVELQQISRESISM